MGYRLHFAKEFKVKWEGGYFSGSETPLVENMLVSECESFWADENSDIWEVNKEELKAYIERLKKEDQDATNEYFVSEDEYVEPYTNGTMVEVLSDILDNSEPEEDYIRMEWF